MSALHSKERKIKYGFRILVFALYLVSILFHSVYASEEKDANLLENGGFEVWSNGNVFNSPDNGQITVDGWATNRDGNAVFSILKDVSKTNSKSDNYAAQISISTSSGAHIIDFFQPIKNRDNYKGEKLIFSAKVRANKAGVCQIIMNDDNGTAASGLNKTTEWEVLTCSRNRGQGALTYMNAAIRIKADEPCVVSVSDCKVNIDRSAANFITNIIRPLKGLWPHPDKSNKFYATYEQLNRSTIFAVDIMLCMLFLGIIMRVIATKNPFVYQLQLATIGLSFTLWLWAHSWEDYAILYSLWFFFTFILMHIFTKSVRVLVLCVVWILSVYYFREKIGNSWDSFLFLGTLQLQFMRSIDIVTTDLDHKKSFKDRFLAFIAYLGVPVNVNNFYYVRYRDWLSHLEHYSGIPKIKDKFSILRKRFFRIIPSFIILMFQERIVSIISHYLSTNTLFITFTYTLISLLAWWPLLNNLLFLGADWLGTPGIEVSNSPILVSSPIDYWRRQQLGVATFFREKIYDNTWGQVKERSRYRNLFYTFAFVGLWHGLTFQWAVWGILWGCVMVINRFYRQHIRRYVIKPFEKAMWAYSLGCWVLTILMLIVLQMVVNRDPNLPWLLTLNRG